MANAMPWSVRGIDPDIREQAVEAAHRSGLSVGQWLNQVLAGSLDDEDEGEDYAPSRHAGRTPRRRHSRIANLGERLDRLGGRNAMTALSRFAEEGDDAPVLDLIERAVKAIERLEAVRAVPGAPRDAGADVLRALEQRIESLSQPRAPAAAPTQDPRLDALIAALNRNASAAHPATTRTGMEDDPAFSRTLAEVEARQRDLDLPGGAMRGPAPARAPAETPAHIDSIRQQLDLLLNRIDDMRSEPRPEATRLQERLTELSNRIQEWGERPQDSIAQLRRDLASLSSSIEELSPQRLVRMVEDAVGRMADRMSRNGADSLPDRLAEPLERLHEDVRAVMREMAGARNNDRLAQEVGNISRRLDLMSEAADPARIEELQRETASIKTLVSQAARSQPLEGLAKQIETISGQIEKFQRSPLPGDDRQILDAIRDVGERLDRLDPSAMMAKVESKLTEIAQSMKKLAKEAQPLPQLENIADRLERIDRALDKSSGSPLAGLDTLTGRLEKIGSSLDRMVDQPTRDDNAPLVAMLEQLSRRMDEVHNTRADSSALDSLQGEIAGLARRIDSASNASAGFDGLERNFSDLLSQIDMARRDMRDAAESAALKAAQETLRNAPRDETGETLAAEGLLLIKRDLNEFKSAQSEAEKRTRTTLEALHATLETMVSRLGEIENRPRMSAASAGASVVPPAMPKADPILPRAAATAQPAARQEPPLSASRPMPPSALDEAADPGDLPLEPGMQPGSASAPQESGDPRTNFIAAARRAAQVAAEKGQAALDEDKTVKGKPRSKLMAGDGNFIARARKPILLGLAALVFSLGALKVLTLRNASAPEPKAPISQPTIPLPKVQPTAPEKSGEAETPAPAKDAPQTTGSSGKPSTSDEHQPLPFGEGLMKRTQRLSDSNAITQADPVTVGSVSGNGETKPIETGKNALAQLVADSNLKGNDKLRQAALDGRTEAIFEIGARLADGRGVARDAKLAARWFEQAAASGHGPSQYRLASLYREGKGIAKDSALAFQWFDRAAAQGHVLAMHNAAVLLAEGVHGTPDYAGAALWFKRAAEHGVKDSQFNIAILFARGLGVNQNLA
ncbi:MAG TPA: hypothetical protein PKW21_05120, partial [Rhabdaerophilum sp.]|nr:hypothetical protein [Rhabdaerophilum sp.]